MQFVLNPEAKNNMPSWIVNSTSIVQHFVNNTHLEKQMGNQE